MKTSDVYFTDFRVHYNGENLPLKLKRLAKTAGINQIDMKGKFVAIKMHFGELGNMSYIRPNYAKAIVDLVKELGGKPFLTDCNTMYPGYRKNAIEHLYCAWENGFTPLTVGCPVIIGDGIKGTDDISVPLKGCKHSKTALIGRAIMDADVIISLTHFKGHEATGFGGTLKNIGMGCGSRAGKKDMHCFGQPVINQEKCKGCKACFKECANNGLVFNTKTKKTNINPKNCVGCGRCLGACNFDAISFKNRNAPSLLNEKMAEYTKAVVDGKPCFHISLIMDVSPLCDCYSENDVPIIPDIGMFASFDPIALDQACADECLKQKPLPNTMLTEALSRKGSKDYHDHFKNLAPTTDWKVQLEYGEKIGLGSRKYKLIKI